MVFNMTSDENHGALPMVVKPIRVKQALDPLDTSLPPEYQCENYPKRQITVYCRNDLDESDVYYRPQSYHLPSPLDENNLIALLGRQSRQHVAIAHMAFGFQKLHDLIIAQPVICDDLLAIYRSGNLHRQLETEVEEQEGAYDPDIDLKSAADRHFPFSPISHNSQEFSNGHE